MAKQTLLLEIGMEECPARFVEPALQALSEAVSKALKDRRLEHGSVMTVGTPRRLTVIIEHVAERQEDLIHEVKGPPARVAFDDEGAPTKAASGFASNQGVAVDSLVVKETDAGPYVYAVRQDPGRPAKEVLPEAMVEALGSLRFPKSMQWGEGGVRFARPIRWIVALLDSDVLPLTFAGVTSDRFSRGHRFLADDPLPIESAADYTRILKEKGWVIVDGEERKQRIKSQVEALAQSVEGVVDADERLLREVAYLVEYPTALIGEFDESYLAVPAEILVTSMKEHQKYFPVRSKEGPLLPRFIAVRSGDDTHLDVVRAGNEKVLSARLADAKFFYDEDLATPLAERVDDLASVLFHEKLGSVREKTERIRGILTRIGENFSPSVRQVTDRAALLSKADLVTQVVGEFPELQGYMGREYALRSGEDQAVADAIFEHYMPRRAQDDVASSLPGALVGIADKIDTIVGCFGIGLVPTGSTDPYALRRQALGIIRTVRHHRPDVVLGSLIDAAIAEYEGTLENDKKIKSEVLKFFQVRLRTLLIEEGIRYDLVDAALACGVDDLIAAENRAKSLQEAAGEERFQRMITAYQRAANLAAKGEGGPVRPERFEDKSEKELWEALKRAHKGVERLINEGRYDQAIAALAELGPPVDAFFDSVLVMDKDEEVRRNRLALLEGVVSAFRDVADLSLVVTD